MDVIKVDPKILSALAESFSIGSLQAQQMAEDFGSSASLGRDQTGNDDLQSNYQTAFSSCSDGVSQLAQMLQEYRDALLDAANNYTTTDNSIAGGMSQAH